jgi:hypothetical protein
MSKIASEIVKVIQEEGFENAPRKGVFFRRKSDHYKIVLVYKDRYSEGYWVDFLIAIQCIASIDLRKQPAAQMSIRASRLPGVDRYAIEAFCGTSPKPSESDLMRGETEFRKSLRAFATMYPTVRDVCEDFRANGLMGWLIIHSDRVKLEKLSDQLRAQTP